jgi:hypothetical protein
LRHYVKPTTTTTTAAAAAATTAAAAATATATTATATATATTYSSNFSIQLLCRYIQFVLKQDANTFHCHLFKGQT